MLSVLDERFYCVKCFRRRGSNVSVLMCYVLALLMTHVEGGPLHS